MSSTRERIVIERTVGARRVPDGMVLELQPGAEGILTQALGDAFTLVIDGQMVRVAGTDADAIGRPPPAAAPTVADAAALTRDDFEALVWKALATCYDPEIPIDIVELGLVYECQVTPGQGDSFDVSITMTLTAPGCGMGPVLVDEAGEKIEALPRAGKVEIDLVFDPPWDRSRISESGLLALGL